jgi:hypothetical protein
MVRELAIPKIFSQSRRADDLRRSYVLALRKAQLEEITAFVSPETFGRFGLPESVA